MTWNELSIMLNTRKSQSLECLEHRSCVLLTVVLRLFNSLAADDAKNLPYNKDIADQRRKYGESMLRKADEHLETQRQYELSSKEQVDAARKVREEDNERQQARLVRCLARRLRAFRD